MRALLLVFELGVVMMAGAVSIAIAARLRDALFLTLDALVNLLPMHGNRLRRVDADADLVAFDTEHRDRDFMSDHYGFTDPASKNQHVMLRPASVGPCRSELDHTEWSAPGGAKFNAFLFL